jgi:hypothetical protein
LLPCDSASSALEKGIVWVEELKPERFTVANVFAECFDHWPSLYRTRVAVIDSLFFVIGGSYEWLDGSIVCTTPEDYLESRARDARRAERLKASIVELEKIGALEQIEILKKRLEPDDAESGLCPIPDDGKPRSFYPVSRAHSNICCVPDDVKDDWFAVAYEAAKILRDRSKAVPIELFGEMRGPDADEVKRQEENRKLGAELVEELERRFASRLR